MNQSTSTLLNKAVALLLALPVIFLLVGCGSHSTQTLKPSAVRATQLRAGSAAPKVVPEFSTPRIGVSNNLPFIPDPEDLPQATLRASCEAQKVLVLYDASGSWGWLGSLYASHLQNLVSHFDLKCKVKPIEQYNKGEIKNSVMTFYIGSVYGNPIPQLFMDEVLASTKPVCWMGYNIWEIAWDPTMAHVNPAFESKFGLRFLGLDAAGSAEIDYKGIALTKDQTDPTISAMQVLDTSLVTVPATVKRATGDLPYIAHAANLWFVADDPFVYCSMTDRNLAFADLMHDMLGIKHKEQHRAILRIEDVHAKQSLDNLRAIADYLASVKVPFCISAIPEYDDPLGVYNNGVPQTIKLADSPDFVKTLQYMQKRGGTIIQHGYTHQYSNQLNPYTGVTAEDYEFYRVTLDAGGNQVLNGPIPGDSKAWAKQRMHTGEELLRKYNLAPAAWLTPHYLASPEDYKAFHSEYDTALDRGLYFTTDAVSGKTYFLQQMAPFIINKDQFGFRRIPETLGYVDPVGYGTVPPNLPADMVARSNADWAVRDGWAGCYFHPYLDIQYLKDLVTGLKGRGYKFVSLDDID